MNKIIQEDLEKIVSAPLPWEEFSGASVLVTGGAGFLPAYMVETLLYLNKHVLSKPVTVMAAIRNEERARKRFSEYSEDTSLRIMRCDIKTIITKADYVIHAASNTSPVHYLTNPVGTIRANTIATDNLLGGAAEYAKSFLFFSSGEAALPVDPLDPRACYSESKRMGETMCAAYARQFGTPAKIVRISHTYGPGMRLDDGRVFADFTRDILKGGPIVLNSFGFAQRPFLYLADATVAFFTVLLKGNVAEAYNVANPNTYKTIQTLAFELAQQFGLEVYRGDARATYIQEVGFQFRPPDIKNTEALGWRPTTGIEEGFKRTVESYR